MKHSFQAAQWCTSREMDHCLVSECLMMMMNDNKGIQQRRNCSLKVMWYLSGMCIETAWMMCCLSVLCHSLCNSIFSAPWLKGWPKGYRMHWEQQTFYIHTEWLLLPASGFLLRSPERWISLTPLCMFSSFHLTFCLFMFLRFSHLMLTFSLIFSYLTLRKKVLLFILSDSDSTVITYL